MGATSNQQHPELADTPALISHLLDQINQLINTQALDNLWLLASIRVESGWRRQSLNIFKHLWVN